MRVTNKTDEEIVIRPGEHLDVYAAVIRKYESPRIAEVVVEDLVA